MADKFGAPKPNANQRSDVVLKTSQQVAASMVKYGVVDKPVHVDPNEFGADPQNRSGATPNIQVIRNTIVAGIQQHGFDPNRPLPGIA
eukprot:1643767-Pyramimonas_sp.AAC.1